MSHPGVSRLAVAAMALLLSSLSAHAQFSFKTGVEAAGFVVTVSDRTGQPVTGLTEADFEVKEDGALQTVSYFSAGAANQAVPLHVGLLFDTSESMERDLGFSRSAAVRFLKTFQTAADFTLVEFAEDVRAARFSQDEFPRLVERIRSTRARGRTSLYDAVTVYLNSAHDQTGRKVLVIYTDGGDTSSSQTWNDIVRLLRLSDVTIYPIGFLSSRGSHRMTQQGRLLEIARLTGGRAFFPNSIRELDRMYSLAAREVGAQYLLGYIPTNSARDGRWRKVDIRLTRPGRERLEVRARAGYFAPQ